MARSPRVTPETLPLTNGHQSSRPDAASRLTMEQHAAIQLLLQGKMDHAVAEAVNVARETISRWRNHNPYFQAVLNQERQALWASAHERLRHLAHRAIDILEAALTAGDAKAAMDLLRIVQIAGAVPPPSGPTDPESLVWQEAAAWAKAARRREGPTIDPIQELLDENAGKDAALLRERLRALRQHWGMDEGSEP